MATNVSYPGPEVALLMDVPAAAVSGSPFSAGLIKGVCLTTRDGNGQASVKTNFKFVVTLDVDAVDANGNSAVVIGDQLYVDNTDNTVDKDSGNSAYGVALEALPSGESAAIMVGVL